MGLLRFYLAVAVLVTHLGLGTRSLVLPYAPVAVFAFFTVSGFYMSLVLARRYEVSRAGLFRFFTNRALRLYPIYWAVLALFQIVRWLPEHELLGQWSFGFTLDQALLLPNVLWRNLTLQPQANTLVVGQAVTIGLEMIFYMAAPLLALCRTRQLVVVWVCAFALLQVPMLVGLPVRPWQYEFAPTVFVFFVTGALSYRIWDELADKRWLAPTAVPLGLAIPLTSLLVDAAGNNDWVRRPSIYLFYGVVALAIPALFTATRHSRIDRFIGDLSYPIYLTQFFAMLITCGRGGPTTAWGRVAAIAVTLGLSVLLVLLVDRPVERLRQRVARRTRERAPDLLKTAPATP